MASTGLFSAVFYSASLFSTGLTSAGFDSVFYSAGLFSDYLVSVDFFSEGFGWDSDFV